MTSISWVDAFTDRAFTGNPAAVCLLTQPLDDAAMQSIAFELGMATTPQRCGRARQYSSALIPGATVTMSVVAK